MPPCHGGDRRFESARGRQLPPESLGVDRVPAYVTTCSRQPHHYVGPITTAPRAFPATDIWRAAPASESLWTAAIGRVRCLSTKSTASRSSASPSGLT